MKVSICIPAYKQVEFLRETLQSVLAQDFTDYELIITDDSPDDSVHQLLTAFSFGEKLRYVRNSPALGSPENWNTAIRLAQGDYVKILHHDDHFIRPDALAQFIRLLDDNPGADFGFSATLVNHVDSGLKRIHCPTVKQLKDLTADPASLFVGNCIGAPSATICRRKVRLEYDLRMKWLVDIDYYFRMLMRNREFAFMPEPLIATPTNATHQVTEICRDVGQVELGEALLMFERFNLEQRENPLVKQGWSNLFRRLRIRKLTQFADYGLQIPEESAYFLPLLKWSHTRWHLLLQPRLLLKKIFYRLYPHVPVFIRLPLKVICVRWREIKGPHG